ncbi:carbamoyltransferase HypF [Sulfuricystis multivorans]|uniref:carbamoyltransferase HypF n=1 Tax=Sulfuricystis multivorans TaxID=2211108 RepID=UPI0024DF79AD|nr:carbamoyltransferase HypF [Sulfuricystis multivorans]
MPEARRIRVTGIVQGVGFRPFVWRLAHELAIRGWVRNDAAGVEIHCEGERLDEFAARLRLEAPPLARIDALQVVPVAAFGAPDFRIFESAGGRVTTAIGHDTATCADCLAELFDPANRRYRHPFITCTHCGPRYTVTRRLPYDRPQTSLAPFPLCPDCAREYTDPADRRFHAETICCPNCGPRLRLCDAAGGVIGGDPIAATLDLLRAGRIVAIKGLGGFHLACDATNAASVAALRARKQREEKPFAVMVADVAQAARYAKIGADETALLEAPERPIVLLEKKIELSGIAPGLAEIGLMLPVTPIQFLLFHDAPEMALVMTSANPHGEPLVIGNDEALIRLAGIADAFLLHDREIVVRCDDSVRRATTFIRRARGYVPRALRLPREVPPALAVGGWFKNTVCVMRGDQAFLSQHVGDLDNAAACGFFAESVAHLLSILDVEPALVAHDLHPDFFSTRFAAQFAAERGIPAIGVQHHHAHIAAVCAEHGIAAPVLGLALDGVGLGTDGTAWGGELLRVEGGAFERLGHLFPLPLPGGDVAAREPWRMATAVLHRLGRTDEIVRRFPDEPAAPTVAQMLMRGFNCPSTSSAGRLFDAMAGMLGVRRRQSFEGQAAMLLEGLAVRHGPVAPLDGGWRIEDGRLDLLPLFAYLEDCEDAAAGAALFHATFAAALTDWVTAAARQTGILTVAASGGCLLNRLLSATLCSSLAERGVRLIKARLLPPNDGGLSLGQAWVAGSRSVCGRA